MTRRVDATGLLCPLPVLKARKVLLAMAPGEFLEIRADDPVAAIDLPHFCAGAGHDLIECRDDGPAQVYLIRRG